MNLALTLPRGLRHPSWYIPLLLPVIPGLCAYVGDDSSQQIACLLGAAAMLAIGLLYSVGLAAWMDRAPRWIRKEVEQLRPAWMVGLFGAQCGFLFRKASDLDGVLVIPSLLYALLAALSFGIEFQQRTMPSLLCSPIDRARLWRVKMGVLAMAILSQVLVLAVSGAFGQWTLFSRFETICENTLVLVGFALAFAVAAWATVPFWTLLTRNLLAGLVFAIFVPTFTFSLIGSLALWLLSPAGFTSDLGIFVFWTLTGSYLLSAPWLAWRRWLHLEAPDQPEREMSGLFLRQRQSSASRATRKRSWFAALIGKELRLQTVTLVCLGVAVMLTVSKPYLPQSMLSQELASLLIGLFTVLTILLAGSTAIAEERRLGTLDPQVLLPVSRTAQWFLKLAVSLAIAVAAIALFHRIVPSSARLIELLLPFGSVLALFVFSFLASSAAPNSLRALILGIAFTAAIVGVCSFTAGLGLAGGEIRLNQPRHQAMDNPEPWLAQARALSETEVAALETPIIPQFLPTLINGSILAALLPLLLALGFSRHNFTHPAAAARRMRLQFPLCLLATLLSACSVVGGMIWLNHQASEQSVLRLARKEVELVDRLSPAERQLFRAVRRQPFAETPEVILVRKRNPPGGILPSPDAADPDPKASRPNARRPSVVWVMDNHYLPLTPKSRATLILESELPEDVREALRQEAIAKGDPGIPTTPGRPPGLWPDRNAQGAFQMSPDLMRRYGLVPQQGQAVLADPTANPSLAPTNAPASTPGNARPQYQMSPELMRRYGLVPTTPPEPSPAPATPTPPKP